MDANHLMQGFLSISAFACASACVSAFFSALSASSSAWQAFAFVDSASHSVAFAVAASRIASSAFSFAAPACCSAATSASSPCALATSACRACSFAFSSPPSAEASASSACALATSACRASSFAFILTPSAEASAFTLANSSWVLASADPPALLAEANCSSALERAVLDSVASASVFFRSAFRASITSFAVLAAMSDFKDACLTLSSSRVTVAQASSASFSLLRSSLMSASCTTCCWTFSFSREISGLDGVWFGVDSSSFFACPLALFFLP
mmetsp:Transcript_10338/g.36293  ORF Transcript_10338/g.36293 Transcript_10338/m.36293 type:complete len:271 (-) Transcript_10338:83-895(-)